ncbi:MAG: sulfurtransferase [Nocardioides sp.]|uniref:sulfurtransferase n=1 Tax=Nocardioides sp. TaxID=35761 RepID=UPI003F0DA68A
MTRRTPLISSAELAATLDDVTVLDVRYQLGGPPGREAYEQGHVPGAVHVDLDSVLASPPGAGGRHPLPGVEEFQDAMRAVGVSNDRPVVVYDDWQGRAAARAWWLLRHHGHPDVRVLDGGWTAWRAAGLGAETGSARVPHPGTFAVSSEPGMPFVEAADVLGVDVLLDARAPERYRGEVEPIDPVAGHIPGARNVPTDRNLDERGLFLPAEDLREVYAEAGAVPGADVAVYCGSGVTAAHDVLALEVAGVRAALYPGSWSGWVADPTRPVERG